MKHKKMYCLTLAALLLLAAGCDQSSSDSNSETESETETEITEAEQRSYVIPEEFPVRSLDVATEEDMIELTYQNGEWVAEGLENPHTPSISTFVDELFSLQGVPTETKSPADGAVSIQLSNEENDFTLEVWSSNEQHYINVSEETFKVEELPLSLQPFDTSFLEEPIAIGLNELTEIEFNEGEETVRLNQETTLNEVEKLPFISGWYLHDVYETPFSIEYQWMEKLLGSFYQLRGPAADTPAANPVQTIILKNGQEQETLMIGESEDGRYTPVTLKEQNQHYLVPNQLLAQYTFEPLNIVDNFIALIPLNAVQTVTIKTEETEYVIEAEHELALNEAEETTLNSTFYLNEQEIDGEIFRRKYQYLARLSYSEKATPEELAGIDEAESTITIDYHYLNDGQTVSERVEFIPIENEDSYIVLKDGRTEFKASDDKLQELFNAFDELL
ncbi:hypothetical protein [Marinilactibacillus piezotolerans]|uniref:hypothetical protein n=1 Tax=Marinilactibacillus piezotolerans TaxID=258723 RepID=UPI0009AF8C72|nr:hypothetical protein [Marinilactibacillus piezotolerans]